MVRSGDRLGACGARANRCQGRRLPDGGRDTIPAAHHRRAAGARDDLLRPPLQRQGSGGDRPHQQVRGAQGSIEGDARLVRDDQGPQPADSAHDQEEPQLRIRPALRVVATRDGAARPCVGLGGKPGRHECVSCRPPARLPEIQDAQQARARGLSGRLRTGSERAAVDAQEKSMTGALAGTRVLDLTRILAGPLCAMMLGDMGAEVIKIEPPGTGDDTRRWGPPFVGSEAAYFLGVNRNKRSLTLNLAAPEGQALLRELAAKADVLIDNFKIGTLEKWGFGDGWFAAHAPRVVRCSITGYGSSGPKAALPGYDFILQAQSGLMSICGEADGEPMKYGVAIVDVCTGMLACNSVLAALQARHATGKGQHVEVSLFESSLSMLVNVASNYLATGRDARRFGNGHPNVVPYSVFPVADGMIAVAVGNDSQFAKFAALLGKPEWAADPRYTRNAERVANRDTLEAGIKEA